jgi:single-stranded DNA-binding protein
MESVNIVILSGLIVADAKVQEEGNSRPYCSFNLLTYRSLGKGKDKELIPEEHDVTLMNPGTISRHLRKGKSVVVQGRVVPGQGVLASSLHFPESRLKNE